jgi:hypothetical protein
LISFYNFGKINILILYMSGLPGQEVFNAPAVSNAAVANKTLISPASIEPLNIAVLYSDYVNDTELPIPIDTVGCVPYYSNPSKSSTQPNGDFTTPCMTQAFLASLFYPNNGMYFNINKCASQSQAINLSSQLFTSSNSIIQTNEAGVHMSGTSVDTFTLFSRIVRVICERNNIQAHMIPKWKLIKLHQELLSKSNLSAWVGTTYSMTYDQVIGHLIDTNILVVENKNNKGSFTVTKEWPVVPISVTAIYTSLVFPNVTLEIILTYNISFVGYNYNNTAINGVTDKGFGFPCIGTVIPAVSETYTAFVEPETSAPEDCDEGDDDADPPSPTPLPTL